MDVGLFLEYSFEVFDTISHGNILISYPPLKKDMELRDVAYVVVAIVLAVAIFYLLIWLLPVIIILIIAYIIYIIMKGASRDF